MSAAHDRQRLKTLLRRWRTDLDILGGATTVDIPTAMAHLGEIKRTVAALNQGAGPLAQYLANIAWLVELVEQNLGGNPLRLANRAARTTSLTRPR